MKTKWKLLCGRCALSHGSSLPASGASCGLILLNPSFLPGSFPYVSPEMKCDFHLFYSSAWMLSLHLCRDCVQSMFRGFWAADWNADWPEDARLVVSPGPVCWHFNYPRESRPFFHFDQPQDFKLGHNPTHYITALLAANGPTAL